ncbi:MAG: trigger factor [Oscillospiraceae bacterium]|jgi:trigger factor|nr:trigger factor [Oscillospiraceae bacterium]
MSFVSKEKTAPATWKVTATISAEAFGKQLAVTAAKELEKITLPGFRKGKAPRAMVEKRYGQDVFFQETLDALLPGAVSDALKEAELEPIFRPEGLEVPEADLEQGVEFTFTVIVQPEVSVGEYRGLKVEVPAAEVTQEDIDARVHELQHRNARQAEVDPPRPAQEGDIAVIDFKGMLDGVAFEGGTAENHELTLGSGQFIPGFEEQVLGRTPGESFDVNVRFPETYHAENLAGKPVVFEVKLHELKAEELPEVDDDFAQEVGEEYNTVEEMKAGIAKELAESKTQQAADAFEHGVQDQLVNLLEGEVPEALFDRRAQRNIEIFLDRIQIPLERYLEIMGEDEEAFAARMKAQSVAQVKLELALETIADKEAIVPEEDEIEAEYQRLAEEYKVELARAKFAVPQDEIVKGLQREKALQLVQKAAEKTAPQE